MTEPDEARIAWNACAAARYDDEENGNPLGLPQGMPNFEDFRDGYRAGAAASAERIKALEAALDQIYDLLSDATQADCENGVRSLNEAAAANYLKDFPHTRKALTDIQAVCRSMLKDPDK